MSKNAQDKDKVDLTTVNKTKSSRPFSNFKKINLLKRQKQDEYKRDNEGKFTAGSGGIKKSNFNWVRALPVVLVVALVGGFLVYRSFASPRGLITDDRGRVVNVSGNNDEDQSQFAKSCDSHRLWTRVCMYLQYDLATLSSDIYDWSPNPLTPDPGERFSKNPSSVGFLKNPHVYPYYRALILQGARGSNIAASGALNKDKLNDKDIAQIRHLLQTFAERGAAQAKSLEDKGIKPSWNDCQTAFKSGASISPNNPREGDDSIRVVLARCRIAYIPRPFEFRAGSRQEHSPDTAKQCGNQKKGDIGVCVVSVQKLLTIFSQKESTGTKLFTVSDINAEYDSKTVDVVKKFQTKNHITATGEVDSNTWSKLLRLSR